MLQDKASILRGLPKIRGAADETLSMSKSTLEEGDSDSGARPVKKS